MLDLKLKPDVHVIKPFWGGNIHGSPYFLIVCVCVWGVVDGWRESTYKARRF